MLGKKIIIGLLFVVSTSFAQDNPWAFPIKPGQINALSGSVGELRNTHFHTGLDIKTEGIDRIGLFEIQRYFEGKMLH